MSEDNRLIGFVLLAALAAVGWILGTSAIFSIFITPDGLPPAVRGFATLIVLGPRRFSGHSLAAPAVAGDSSLVAVSRLLGLAFIELPLFVFLAPLLLGWLPQPVVYRPLEAAAVWTMALVVVAWTVFLALRAARRSRVNDHEGPRVA